MGLSHTRKKPRKREDRRIIDIFRFLSAGMVQQLSSAAAASSHDGAPQTETSKQTLKGSAMPVTMVLALVLAIMNHCCRAGKPGMEVNAHALKNLMYQGQDGFDYTLKSIIQGSPISTRCTVPLHITVNYMSC